MTRHKIIFFSSSTFGRLALKKIMSCATTRCVHHWDPCNDILTNFKSANYAVIVLNCQMHFSFPHTTVLNLWTNAKFRLTVDGGTNRWRNWIKEHNFDNATLPFPDLITGDMDSIGQDVIDYFMERNSNLQLVKTPDQDETDFTKALRVAKDFVTEHHLEIDTIYVLGDTSGRFDQIMANINTLFKASSFFNVKIFQLASNSITWLLQPGIQHVISVPESIRKSKEWCALLPIGGPCRVTSKGLQWDLENSELSFGGMVSSSNTYTDANEISIKTDSPLVWSMGIKTLLQESC